LAATRTHIGVALQAEHEAPSQRDAAPLLAVLPLQQDARLRPVETAVGCGGYAGDVLPLADGFLVSATRAGQVWQWTAPQRPPAPAAWERRADWDRACALAGLAGSAWVAGAAGLLKLPTGEPASQVAHLASMPPTPLDNHLARWLVPPAGIEPASGA
jgi:uncharacterized protein